MSVRETLELDIADALSSIEEVGNRLTNVAQAFGEVLAESMEAALSGLPIIQPAVDVESIGDEISAAVQEADTAIQIDSQEAIADVEANLAALDGFILDFGVDTEEARAEIWALSEIDIPGIPITADTSQAQAAIDGLASSVEGLGDAGADAGGGMTAAGNGVIQAAFAAGGSSSIFNKAKDTLKGIGPIGILASVGFTAAAKGITDLADNARPAVASGQAFNSAFGDAADTFLKLDPILGGFNGTITDLAISTGSSGRATREASQNFLLYRQSVGDSVPEADALNQQLVTSAATLRVLNPNLGTTDELVRKLQQASLRGEAAFARMNISVSKAEIEQRALQNTSKSTADELTRAEKQAAGIQLAYEKLGPTQAMIASGMDNVGIASATADLKIAALKTRLGAPLVEPLTDFKVQVNETFVTLGDAILPFFQSFGREVGNAVKGFTEIMERARPAIEFVAGAFKSVGDAGEEAEGGVSAVGEALRVLFTNVITNIPIIGPVAGFLRNLGVMAGESTEGLDSQTEALDRNRVVMERLRYQTQLETEAVQNAVAAHRDAGVAMSEFATAAQGNIPTVAQAFGEITKETNADTLTTNLKAQITATEKWTFDMANAYTMGFDNIALLLANVGPTQSAILLEQYRGREQELEIHLSMMAQAQQTAMAKVNEIALRGYLQLRGVTEHEANAVVLAFGAELQLGVPTAAAIEAMLREPGVKRMAAEAEFGALAKASLDATERYLNTDEGKRVAAALDAGLGDGLAKEDAQAIWKATIYAQRVKDAINGVLGVKSPSTEMMKTGYELARGLAMGIESNTGLVDTAIGSLGQSALGLTVSAGLPGARGTAPINISVPITVAGGMTAEDGARIGEAAGAAAADQLRRRMRLEALVA